jgi:hypothetical protein
MYDVIAALISLFLIQPLQVELSETLATAKAPQAVVAEVTTCARDATTSLIDRAVEEPGWAASSAIGLWTGWVTPDQFLVQAVPGCSAAVEAARPFIAEQS